jgi:error-prone DNA polymerase
VTFLRPNLARDRCRTCAAVNNLKDGASCKLAGLVRQRPGSAKNVTLEDETGVANLVIWAQLYEKQHRLILTGSMFGVSGRVQREGDVVHIVAYKLFDLSEVLARVGGRKAPPSHDRGDELPRGPPPPDPRDAAGLRLKSRNFH